MSKQRAIAALSLLTLFFVSPLSAFVPIKPIATIVEKISRHSKALPDDEIVRLARLASESKGTKSVGLILGKKNLPNEVLEDAYLRIAVQQNRVSRREAEEMFERMSGTDGFRSTLRKIVGNNGAGTAGHLNELRIANTAVRHGFKVRGIGVRFNDGIKKADTDIDVLLKMGNRTVAIEAKDYLPSTRIPIETFRADMATLAEYKKREAPKKLIPVFSITNAPGDAATLRILENEADKHGVQLIFGSPEQQVEQIKQLLSIL